MRKLRTVLVVLALAVAARANAQVIAMAPIDSWSFDETSGTIAHNSIPGGADGILNNGAVFVPGINGNAVYLPPFASVDFASPTGNLGTSDFTISFWLKTTGDGIGNPFSSFCELLGNRGAEGSADTPYIDFRMKRTGDLTLEVTGFGESGYVAAATDPNAGVVNDGNWHFIIGVRRGTQIQIYVDGMLRATATAGTVADVQSLYDFAAGANANTFNFGLPFNGTIDGLKIYDRALSEVEILIALTQELIEGMVAGGTLAANKANPLITKLEAVSAKLEGGQLGAACNQLGAFINQVNAYISNGTLTAADGQALIDAANAIQVNLGCEPPADGCPNPPPGTTCPCMAASFEFAIIVFFPGTCFDEDQGRFIRKEVTGGAFVSASCIGNSPGTGFCATSSGFILRTTAEEGTACVRLIRASCAP